MNDHNPEEYTDFGTPKQKRGTWLARQRPSVIIIEALLVIVAIVAALRFLFPSSSAPLPPLVKPDPDVLYENGELHLGEEEYAQARDAFTQAIEAGYVPISMAYFQRGLANYELEDYSAAIDDFSYSLRNDPACEQECYVDYHNRGLAYENLEHYDEALRDFTQAIETKPDYESSYQSRGEIYLELGNTTLALRDLNTALNLRQSSIKQRGMPSDGGTRSGTLEQGGEQAHFTFYGKAGQRLTISLTSNNLDVVLALRDAAGSLLAYADDEANEIYNAVIQDYVLPEDGTYTIIAAAYQHARTGNYTLNVRVAELSILSPASFAPITPDNAVRLTDYVQFERQWSGAGAWSADGTLFFEDGTGSNFLLYNTREDAPHGQPVNIAMDDYFPTVALNPDAAQAALALNDDIVLYSLTTGERLSVLRDHDDSITALVYSPDGMYLVSTAIDKVAYVWRADTGKLVLALPTEMSSIHAAAYQPRGLQVALGGMKGMVEIWNAATGKRLKQSSAPDASQITALAYNPNGDKLAVASETGGLWLLDSSTLQILNTYPGHRRGIHAVAFSPDGRLIATAGEDGTVRVWGLSDSLALAVLEGHHKPVTSLAFRADGRVLASAGDDETVYLWRVQ